MNVFRTDPVENLNSYVMVHGGIDRHERLLDVEWMRDVVNAARDATDPSHIIDPEKQDAAIDKLRRVLRDRRY